MARAGVPARNGKKGESSDVMSKFSGAASKVRDEVSTTASRVAGELRGAIGSVEGTVKAYPAQSAGVAVVALLLTLVSAGFLPV